MRKDSTQSDLRDENCPIFDPLSDRREIKFQGQTFYPTSRQADIITIMLIAHRDGKSAMTEDFIYGQLGSLNGRLRDSFRSRPDIVETLILQGPHRGYWQLHPAYLEACGIRVKGNARD